MPPQPRSGMKPDPTMLLCYVPDLVFTINRDAPFIYRGAICGMRNVRDILTLFFSDRIYAIVRMFFSVFHLGKDRVGNWLRARMATCWVTWVRWVEGVTGYGLRVTGPELRITSYGFRVAG
jgi:hypothetical protein